MGHSVSMCLSSPLHSVKHINVETALAAFLDLDGQEEEHEIVKVPQAIPLQLYDTWCHGCSVSQFLCSPMSASVGFVRFRLIGDHSSKTLWISFDYDQTTRPHVAKALVTICPQSDQQAARYTLHSGEDASVIGEVTRQPRSLFGRKEDQYHVSTQGGDGEVLISRVREGIIGKKRPRSIKACMDFGAMQLNYNNKAPTYNERIKSYTMDFGGRVRQSSIKNFILERPDGVTVVEPYQAQPEQPEQPNSYPLRFGRISQKTEHGPAEFALDVGYPLSPLQGIGIAIANISSKLT